eukprot:9488410-Pyramimonas_sp.AAC.1
MGPVRVWAPGATAGGGIARRDRCRAAEAASGGVCQAASACGRACQLGRLLARRLAEGLTPGSLLRKKTNLIRGIKENTWRMTGPKEKFVFGKPTRGGVGHTTIM